MLWPGCCVVVEPSACVMVTVVSTSMAPSTSSKPGRRARRCRRGDRAMRRARPARRVVGVCDHPEARPALGDADHESARALRRPSRRGSTRWRRSRPCRHRRRRRRRAASRRHAPSRGLEVGEVLHRPIAGRQLSPAGTGSRTPSGARRQRALAEQRPRRLTGREPARLLPRRRDGPGRLRGTASPSARTRRGVRLVHEPATRRRACDPASAGWPSLRRSVIRPAAKATTARPSAPMTAMPRTMPRPRRGAAVG